MASTGPRGARRCGGAAIGAAATRGASARKRARQVEKYSLHACPRAKQLSQGGVRPAELGKQVAHVREWIREKAANSFLGHDTHHGQLQMREAERRVFAHTGRVASCEPWLGFGSCRTSGRVRASMECSCTRRVVMAMHDRSGPKTAKSERGRISKIRAHGVTLVSRG